MCVAFLLIYLSEHDCCPSPAVVLSSCDGEAALPVDLKGPIAAKLVKQAFQAILLNMSFMLDKQPS